MLDLFNIAKPQGCDIQTFYGSGAPSATQSVKSWVKPRGVSHVYMMLIGGGGDGGTGSGGGSGAVTVWYGAAQHVPDVLDVYVGDSGQASQIKYRQSGTSAQLLVANAGTNGAGGGAGGSASAANNFTASGFFQSVTGQTGGSSGPSSTIFLSGGDIATQTGNYGYSSGKNGYFQMQPIIVGVGSQSGTAAGSSGVGCGGGGGSGLGGQGMVLIASW